MTPRVERDVVRVLLRDARAHDLPCEADVVARRDWASALFEGARLTIAITGPGGEAFDRWLTLLPEADLPLTGHFVADAGLIAHPEPARAVIELLVIAEDQPTRAAS